MLPLAAKRGMVKQTGAAGSAASMIYSKLKP